jgi:hypothetical protein
MKKKLLSNLFLSTIILLAILPTQLQAQCIIGGSIFMPADRDVYGSKTEEILCTVCLANLALYGNSGCVDISDCDDNDPNLTPYTLYYQDSDGDGYYKATWKSWYYQPGDSLYGCNGANGKFILSGKKFTYNHIFYGNKTWDYNLNASLCIDETNKKIGICDETTATKPKITDNLNVTIYPNPSTGLFNLNTSVKNIQYKIYNTIGVEIKSDEIENYITEIDLSSEPNGVYILQLISGNNSEEIAIIKD